MTLSANALINKKIGPFSLSFFFLTSKITFPAAPTKDKPYMTTAAHCGEAAVWMIGRRCRPRESWLRRRIYLFIEGNVCSLVGVVLVNGRPSAYACCFDNLRGCSASENRDWALPAPTSIYNTARFAAFNYPKPINSQFVYYLLTLSFKSQKSSGSEL